MGSRNGWLRSPRGVARHINGLAKFRPITVIMENCDRLFIKGLGQMELIMPLCCTAVRNCNMAADRPWAASKASICSAISGMTRQLVKGVLLMAHRRLSGARREPIGDSDPFPLSDTKYTSVSPCGAWRGRKKRKSAFSQTRSALPLKADVAAVGRESPK